MEMLGQRAGHDLLAGRPRDALAVVEPVVDHLDGRALAQACTVAVPALVVVGRGHAAAALSERAMRARDELGDQPILADIGIHVAARALAVPGPLSGPLVVDAVDLGNGSGEWGQVRNGCCIWHRSADAVACLTCPLLDAAERRERTIEWVNQRP